MNATAFLPLLADSTQSELRWHALPPAWVLALVIVPAVIGLAWWGYQRERDVSLRGRLALASLRTGALLAFLLLFFGPYMEISQLRSVRSHLVVLLDVSDSMSTEDGYEDADLRALAAASGSTTDALAGRSRLELARDVLGNPNSGFLERLTEEFRVHVLTIGSQLTPLVSTGDAEDDGQAVEETPADAIRRRLESATPREPSTRIGQGVANVLDTFKLRDEAVAGIVVISDGQNNAGSPSPRIAGRRANSQRVPVFAVGVGDPRSPRNINVSNLRAKEVVLARDTALFEFTVRAKGFEGRPARLEMRKLDDNGEPTGSALSISPDAVVLEGGDTEQRVKIQHAFVRAGTYVLRIGVPPQPEERIENDNWVSHTIRVIDRKIRVLYVEGPPRHEFHFLSTALTRDRETMLAHTLLIDADADTPQRATRTPGWRSLDMTAGLPNREELFEYDVVILGDIDPRRLAPKRADAEQAVANLHEFVEKGGGLIVVAGPRHTPSRYRDTPLQAILPVVIDRAAESLDPQIDTRVGFPLLLTPEGERSPMMNITGDAAISKRMWEQTPEWRQYWAYPALRAKTIARVLAVSGAPQHENKFGPRPALATMLYGRGRTLFVGVEELWRLRFLVGDRYFYRFYGEAVRFLATYKLLGGNRRFKILTDRDTYQLDDSVSITLDVLDDDYEPSREEAQIVELDMPGERPGTRETVELSIPAAGREEPGTYRKTIVPTRAGQYRLSRAPERPDEEAAKKLFQVVQSSLEGRDLLLDESTLRSLSDSSAGGRYMNLWDLPELVPESRAEAVPTDVQPRELWDNGWALLLAVGLLAAEWLLRKRWQLV